MTQKIAIFFGGPADGVRWATTELSPSIYWALCPPMQIGSFADLRGVEMARMERAVYVRVTPSTGRLGDWADNTLDRSRAPNQEAALYVYRGRM